MFLEERKVKMKMIRKFELLSLLFVVTLFVQDTSALLVLPHSTYGDLYGWQGSRIYKDNGFHVLIDFTVYDTETYLNEFIGTDGFVNPGQGRYIYAYQIFNHPSAEEDIEYFSIFGIETTIDEATIDGLSSQDDGEEGVPTSDEYFDDDLARVLWEFDWGVLIPSKHSYFLVLSSNYEPVAGDYEIRSFEEEGQPGVPAPEPGTLTLLGLGALAAFIRRRKSV
jgi:hypothetical protein